MYMSLLQMSFLGTVIILLIVVLRAVLINRLPKKTFLILWWIALIRLLVPFSIKSVTSIYSLLQSIYSDINPVRTAQTTTFLPIHGNMPEIANGLSEAMVQRTESISILSVIWLAGLLLCFGFFAVSYIKCYREFRFSLPVENDILEAWKEKHPLKRSLSIRQTETIAAPLSYGVIRPVILMPKNTEWKNIYQLRYVLEHEYVHIRRLDMLTKLIMIAAVCIHWFNPLVWVMYILFNRDLELSCDETVVRRFGMDIKSVYATALISMEEKKSGLTPLCNSFSKNAIEERIRAIMKIKKTSKFAVIISAVLVICVTGGFATSASSLEKKTETAQENGETTVALNEVNIREDESLSSSDVEWWTAEEYAKWLDEEKEVLQSMIGEKAYTGGDGWFVWTQEKVDETIALYEDNLQKIKDGMKLSKSSDDAVGITMAYSPENIEYAKQEAETVTENKDSNENVFSEEQLSEYAKAGITYQKETGFLMYDGKTIGYFRDEFKPGTYTISSKRGGTLRVEVQRENYGTITDVKAEPLSDDFWSEPAALVESSGGEAVTADEMKGSVFEEGGSENIAADDMGEYSSEEGKGLNIAVPQEYADYGVSCDAQGNWVYNGKIIADLYDEGRGIFSNSNGTMYIEVTRDKSGKISSFQKVSKNRMQELFAEFNPETETSLDKGTQRKTTENELPSLTQCTA
jgi:beta-lactamase regulating signal transducer with metallopeptidase domain